MDGIHGSELAGIATVGTALFAWAMLFFTADQPYSVPRPSWLGKYCGPAHMAIRLIACISWLLILAGAVSSAFAIFFEEAGAPGMLTAEEQNNFGVFLRTIAGPVVLCQCAGNTWRIILRRAGVPDKQDA